MRIIFSRKGFDSAAGGVPSPILPSGLLCSLPIPEPGDDEARGVPYEAIRCEGLSLGPLVADLTGGRLRPHTPAHLDPDLDPHTRPRLPGWRPIFGQTMAAEGHLRNQKVGAGDLFLFFGWFREVEEASGGFGYRRDRPGCHLLFGWLQVGWRLPLSEPTRLPKWAREHPHVVAPYHHNDSLYVAADRVHLDGDTTELPGAGTFRRYHPRLRLTAPGASRSVWTLPSWIHPARRRSALSYHGRRERWSRSQGRTLLRTVGRGQEFVLDCSHYPEAVAWARELLLTCAAG